MLQGLFVYEGTGQVDWAQIAEQGYSYAWIKATEGIHHTDALWAENVQGARDNGISVGHLHYLDVGNTAPTMRDQADYFLLTIGNVEEGERVIVDVEDSRLWLFDLAVYFCRSVALGMGFRPLIYTRRELIDLYPPSDMLVAQCGLSLAEWGDTLGPPPYPWPVVADWQWNCNGAVRGIDGPVCLHRFLGGISQLARYGRPR